jgi:hypothetical protein
MLQVKKKKKENSHTSVLTFANDVKAVSCAPSQIRIKNLLSQYQYGRKEEDHSSAFAAHKFAIHARRDCVVCSPCLCNMFAFMRFFVISAVLALSVSSESNGKTGE